MIKIKIPNNNINERKYILDIVFKEFLCLEYNLEISSKDYIIILDNEKELIIKDTFFNRYPEDLEYLKLENIPNKIEELDIFAMSFFMLTRWEEYVNKNRDSHNRFPASESLAFKDDFLDRPIINELLEKLKKTLFLLDSSLKFKENKYQLHLTHDVDELYMLKSWKQVLKIGLGDIIKRKSVFLAFERISQYFLVKRSIIKDPFDNFDWLMDKSESVNKKSRFYFMSGGTSSNDNNYKIDEKKSLELISNIKKRNHIIGFHPSYNAYNDSKQFKNELDLLKKITGLNIIEGREHYLRFEVPTTWQIWEDNGMAVDSTCGYADFEGFRCGTGDEFSVFNILTRKKLKLKERPLIYMDDNRLKGDRIHDEELLANTINNLKNKAIKYKSTHTILFHQNIFANKGINYKDIYEKIIK